MRMHSDPFEYDYRFAEYEYEYEDLRALCASMFQNLPFGRMRWH
jgi:hypothetical protein